MKKLFLVMAICAGVMCFTSCEDNEVLNAIVSELTGSASATLGDSELTEQPNFTASIAMVGEKAEETDKEADYVIGISANLSIDQLLNITSAAALPYPFMAYRLSGVTTGTRTLTNPLTSEEILNFDYTSLFSNNLKDNFVAIALNDSVFYVMTSGTIDVTTLDDSKVEASFTGHAQKINRHEGVAQLFENTFTFSGQFASRRSTLLNWLAN